MSPGSDVDPDADAAPESPLESVADPSRYQGPERYVRVAEDFLDVELTAVQRRILRAVGEHKRVYVQSGNGVGKSFAAAVLNLAFLIRHPDSTNMATSGTYSVLSDVLWKPMRALFNRSGLPGRALESPPRIELDDEWYFKCVAPRHPGNLEGRHAGTMLVTIEEVDKPDISREHFDSAESMLTSAEDRILAISNPPEDEANVAHSLKESDRWHTIQFSSFDSRNVLVDVGETDADRVSGLVDLETVREDWETWNSELWPGLETARAAHRRRDDLDSRWYRRRAGAMPPAGASAHRPFHVADVQAAWDRDAETAPETPDGVGIDVARSGDRTVLAAVHGDVLRIHYNEQGTNHTAQEPQLRRSLDEWPAVEIAVDAVGEGSGLGDRLQQAYPNVTRFKAGAAAGDEYKDRWAEGLAALGGFFDEGGVIRHRDLREELQIAARTVEYEERYLASRGSDGAQVLEATSKSAITDTLGHSPDLLDAALMAAWACTDREWSTLVSRDFGPQLDDIGWGSTRSGTSTSLSRRRLGDRSRRGGR